MNTRHASRWFWLTLPAVLMVALSTGETATTQSQATANVKTVEGLTVVTFKVDSGTIKVNLPDDMAAGDTISGTVVVEPKGQTEQERAQNRASFETFALKFADQTVPLAQSFTLVLPSPSPKVDSDRVIKIVESTSGKEVVITSLGPLKRYYGGRLHAFETLKQTQRLPPLVPSGDYYFPNLGQQGRSLEIFGPFDGNSSNTTLRFGPPASTFQDFEKGTENVSGGFGLIRPLAESPRKVVFESPTNVTGPIGIMVREGDRTALSFYRNVGVNLTAPKTNLLKGEKTILTTEVTGLQGIKEPVPLTLEAKGVIAMEGGMFQPLFIQPSQVGADGRYVTTRGITGVQAGGWSATSTVVTTPFNIVLRDPDPPQTFLLNSFTGDYIFCGKGSKLTGTGQVQMKGCILTLTHNAPDRRVFGRLDACTPVDNARYFTFYTPGTNTDITVNVTDTKPTRTRLYFNPLNRPAPPVQDVSAFATCP